MIISWPVSRRSVATLACTASLLAGGCATLPSNGPTGRQVRKGAEHSQPPLKFEITDITPDLVPKLKKEDGALASQVPSLAQLARSSRADQIGPGDELNISIFEIGVALFGGGSQISGDGLDSSAHAQTFPTVTVGSDGAVDLPFVGHVNVAGKTLAEVQATIDASLRGKSQNPQALVTFKENVANSAYISGELRRPGRFQISAGRENLLDAIAASGGSVNSAEDTIVRFTRDGRTVEERLAFIRAGTPDNLIMAPGDHVELLKRPRSYTVFGAITRASQQNFETGEVTLAEAIARAGGPNDTVADASAVYLFRYDGVPDSIDAGPPRVYRLNMLQPSAYLLAQRINMRDKDVLYFANSAANQPSKLVSILNQLFSPLVTARALSR